MEGEIMRGKPELKIEREKINKTKKNSNGMFSARMWRIFFAIINFQNFIEIRVKI
jgi:hypothetical protein